MKLITVCCALTDWKKIITYTDDAFSTTEIKQLRDIVTTERKMKVSFVFKGILLVDETTLSSLVSGFAYV